MSSATPATPAPEADRAAKAAAVRTAKTGSRSVARAAATPNAASTTSRTATGSTPTRSCAAAGRSRGRPGALAVFGGRDNRAMPALAALIAVTAVWGVTFVQVKDAVAIYPLFAFLAVRYALATGALAVVGVARLPRLGRSGSAGVADRDDRALRGALRRGRPDARRDGDVFRRFRRDRARARGPLDPARRDGVGRPHRHGRVRERAGVPDPGLGAAPVERAADRDRFLARNRVGRLLRLRLQRRPARLGRLDRLRVDHGRDRPRRACSRRRARPARPPRLGGFG